MWRALDRSTLSCLALAIAITFALALGGCSSSAVFDQVPASVGGEPADTPARPATPYQYPAVHDMPQQRALPTMSEEQEVKAEKDLATVRDKQKARTGTDKTAANPAKKKPETGDKGQIVNGQGAGSQDGAATNP